MDAQQNPPESGSLLNPPLKWITELILQAPQATLVVCTALACLCVGIAVNGLEFKTSRLDLLSRRSEYNRRWLSYQAEFGEQDDAVIVVQGDSPQSIQPALDDLATELKKNSANFGSVFSQRDLSKLKAKALHFLPPEQVARLEAQVESARTTLEKGAAAEDVVAELREWNDFWEGRPRQLSGAARSAEQDYAALTGGLLAALQPAAASQLPNGSLPAELNEDFSQLDPQYLLAAKGRIGFVLLRLQQRGQSFVRNDEAVKALQKVITLVAPRHPDVWIGVTGMPVVEHDEMEASGTDTFYSTFISLVGVMLMFVAGYGGLRHAGLACLALLFGIAWSFGFVTLAVGHLNILSASFGAILVGLGIDFGIHYIAAYLKSRQQGLDCRAALAATSLLVGPGIVIGAVTTSASFFMAGLTEFVGIAELGIIAGGGVICCLFAAIVVLPPLVLLVDEAWPLEEHPGILPLGRWLRPLHVPPQFMMTVCIVAVLALSAGLTQLRYDHNLLNMQPRRLESAAIERELFTRLDDSIWYAISVCESRVELLQRKERLAKFDSVAKVEEIVSLLPTPDERRARKVAQLQDSLLAIDRQAPLVPVELPKLQAELMRAERVAREQEWDRGPAGQALGGLRHCLAAMPPAESQRRIDGLRAELALKIRQQLKPLQNVCDPLPPTLGDLPTELTDRFVGKNQRHLLKIYARGNIWEMEELQQFIADCEAVDPLVTGHPVQTYYVCHHLQQSYLMAGVMSLIVVFGLVYLEFQSIRDTLLAMMPLALGSVAMLGLIGWLDVPLNPANMIVLPIILGIGVDDGVHLIHAFRRQKGRFRLTDSTATSVLLTSTTTMVSFGAMIFARHQGLQTLGQVLTLGSCCCMLTSLLFFPCLLSWLTRHREEIEEEEDFVPTVSITSPLTDASAAEAEIEDVPPRNYFAAWQLEDLEREPLSWAQEDAEEDLVEEPTADVTHGQSTRAA